MVSSSTTVPRSGVYYFSQGWKLVTLPGIRRFVIFTLAGQHCADGRRILVAVCNLTHADTFVDESCAGLAAAG